MAVHQLVKAEDKD